MGLFRRGNTKSLPGRRRFNDQDKTDQELSTDNMFQRNRSLVRGSYASRGSSSDGELSDRAHVHNLTSKRRKVGLLMVSVFSISIFVFWLLTQFTSKVVIALSDTTTVKSVEDSLYIKSINDYMDSHPFSRLRFALDVDDLTNYLHLERPEVLSVESVSSESIGSTTVTLSMRHPLAGWTIAGNDYFVDSYGVAFERNYYASPSLKIVDNSGITPEQGTTVASNNFLSFVGRVVALSKDNGYTVEQAIIPSGTTRQLEIQISGVKPHIIFSIDRAAGEQVEDMARSLKYLSDRGLSPAKVDVRVSGKAFYL